MVGFVLIYRPHLPESFNVDEKAKGPRWIEAIYFSGITLTTLGYGDIAPRSTAMRLVALSEASAGFVSISLAVTYLITVAGALERKRIVASSFYHQAEQGADAASFIARHFVNGKFYFGMQKTSPARLHYLEFVIGPTLTEKSGANDSV